MLYRRRLRTRIILSFLLLGTGLTTLFVISTLLLRSRIENQLVETWLQKEVRNFVDFKRQHPEPEAQYELSAQRIELFVYRPDSPKMPPEWRTLATGVHDLTDPSIGGREGRIKVAVEREPDIVGFLRYSYGNESLNLQQLLVLMAFAMALCSLLAWLIGVWSSRRVMQPVTELVRRVRALSIDGPPEMLAPHFLDDEVGQLAAALDEYAERLTHLVRRDREFNADVSHELRTPLAVIHGATELMLASAEPSDKMRQRLQRIDRAAQQSTHLITALLMLSRNERGTGSTNLLQLVNQLLESNRAQLAGKPVKLRAEGDAEASVDVPEAILSVAIGNLIGNACKYTAAGDVLVKVARDCVQVIDSGPGISAEDAAHLFERGFRGESSSGTKGAGIGLSIVGRLCELYGWKVAIAPRQDARGAIASLSFDPSRSSPSAR